MSIYLDERYRNLKPYVPGEQPGQVRLIKLNTNENPYPPSAAAQRAAASEAERLQLYGDPEAKFLLQALSRLLDVPAAQVFAGNGSDEVLAFCFQAFCQNGAAFADITYGFYSVYAQLYGLNARVIPLREDFSVAPADYVGLGRTLFIANPNAPTALALTRSQMEDILRQNEGNLVVVDEAYVDFGAESCVPLLPRYDNLLVVGTFSKSRSMAGGRLGYAVGSEALIADLNRIKYSFNPYNLNRMTMAAGAAAADDTAYFEECRARIVATRDKTKVELEELGFSCTDSRANFLFAAHKTMPGRVLFDKLRERGILVRRWDLPRISNYLRITVGADEEMRELLAAVRDILGGRECGEARQ